MNDVTETPPGPIMLRSPQDLLASIPYQLGFRPAESVVLACVSADRRLDLVARVDLDDLDDLDDLRGASALGALQRAVARVDPAWCALVVYTARPESAALASVEAVRAGVGPAVDLDEWIITPHGYRGLGCRDETCCPPLGHPLETLEVSAAGAAHVLAGRFVADSAEEAFGIRAADGELRALAARAARRSEDALVRAIDDGGRWRRDALGQWRRALRGAVGAGAGEHARTGPAVLGRVAAALADRVTRDAVLLTLVPGGDEVADGMVGTTARTEAATDAATARLLASVTDPGTAARPEPTRVRGATAALEDVVAHAPRRLTPAPLTLLAFLAWWQGDGPRAAFRITQVLDVDPGHRLALLLGSVLEAGLPPGWVRAGLDEPPPATLTSGRRVG